MAVNPLANDDAGSVHGVRMSEEAFEQLIGLEGPCRYEWYIVSQLAGSKSAMYQKRLLGSIS